MGRSRILRGWVSDLSGDVGHGFCVTVNFKKPAGIGLFGYGPLLLLCRHAPNSGTSLSCYQREPATESIILLTLARFGIVDLLQALAHSPAGGFDVAIQFAGV